MNQLQGNDIVRASLSSQTSESLHNAALAAANGQSEGISFNATGNTQEMLGRPSPTTVGRNETGGFGTSVKSP